MPRRYVKFVSVFAATALALNSVAPAWGQNVPAGFTRADYVACQTKDERSFREAIRKITHDALLKGVGNLNFDALVADHWRAMNLDKAVDAQVDKAAAQVREETSWSKLITSLAYREQARELAQAVAERTYRSDALKMAIEGLATRVGRDVGQSIVLTTSDTALPAQRCLEAYLGPRYGQTVARSVNQDASAAFRIDPEANKAKVTSGTVLLETSQGIAGAVLLLVRRQMARMASRLGQRLVGSVLGRLVSTVVGGVGLALVAKEIWELRNGVLPIIAGEMKSSGSKKKVQEELAKSIRTQISEHLDELSQRTADRIVDIWHEFRRAHAQVVALTQKHDGFRDFVDAARPGQLARLDEIVALVIANEDEGAVLSRLKDGTLHTALNRLPQSGLQIAREKKSLGDALAWHALAGARLDDVAAAGLHESNSPDAFSRTSLERLLSLDDPRTATRLASIGRAARDVLLELKDDQLVQLARSLTPEELATLSGYLTKLETAPAQPPPAPGRDRSSKVPAINAAARAGCDPGQPGPAGRRRHDAGQQIRLRCFRPVPRCAACRRRACQPATVVGAAPGRVDHVRPVTPAAASYSSPAPVRTATERGLKGLRARGP